MPCNCGSRLSVFLFQRSCQKSFQQTKLLTSLIQKLAWRRSSLKRNLLVRQMLSLVKLPSSSWYIPLLTEILMSFGRPRCRKLNLNRSIRRRFQTARQVIMMLRAWLVCTKTSHCRRRDKDKHKVSELISNSTSAWTPPWRAPITSFVCSRTVSVRWKTILQAPRVSHHSLAVCFCPVLFCVLEQ